ncbi:MAG: hypothetical protein ACI8PZ_005955 [Myxococcota bacterium]|jgi:hypothetical protein
MDPSDVRRAVLAEHRQIRQRLDDLLEQAHGGADAATLLTTCQALLPVLLDHIDLEDRILVPALREADSFGDVRVDMLVRHHEAQRVELRTAIAALGQPGTERAAILQAVRTLVYDLRIDMAEEDRDLLSPEVLRDDLIQLTPGS